MDPKSLRQVLNGIKIALFVLAAAVVALIVVVILLSTGVIKTEQQASNDQKGGETVVAHEPPPQRLKQVSHSPVLGEGSYSLPKEGGAKRQILTITTQDGDTAFSDPFGAPVVRLLVAPGQAVREGELVYPRFREGECEWTVNGFNTYSANLDSLYVVLPPYASQKYCFVDPGWCVYLSAAGDVVVTIDSQLELPNPVETKLPEHYPPKLHAVAELSSIGDKAFLGYFCGVDENLLSLHVQHIEYPSGFVADHVAPLPISTQAPAHSLALAVFPFSPQLLCAWIEQDRLTVQTVVFDEHQDTLQVATAEPVVHAAQSTIDILDLCGVDESHVFLLVRRPGAVAALVQVDENGAKVGELVLPKDVAAAAFVHVAPLECILATCDPQGNLALYAFGGGPSIRASYDLPAKPQGVLGTKLTMDLMDAQPTSVTLALRSCSADGATVTLNRVDYNPISASFEVSHDMDLLGSADAVLGPFWALSANSALTACGPRKDLHHLEVFDGNETYEELACVALEDAQGPQPLEAQVFSRRARVVLDHEEVAAPGAKILTGPSTSLLPLHATLALEIVER